MFEIFIWSQKKEMNLGYSFRVERGAKRTFRYLLQKKKPRMGMQ